MPKTLAPAATHEARPAPQRAKPAEAAPARSASLRHLAPGAIVRRALATPHSLRPAELMAIQRALGNRAAGAMLGRAPVQAKLTVNAPGDRYEREADRVARQVVEQISQPVDRRLQRQKEEPKAQPKPLGGLPQRRQDDEMGMTPAVKERSGGGGMAAPSGLDAAIRRGRYAGRPLDEKHSTPDGGGIWS